MNAIGNVFGNESVTAIKLGRFSPEATRSDLIYGLEFSNSIDKYLEFGLSLDYFHNTHTEETDVNTLISGSGTAIAQKQVTLETHTQYVPILANLRVKLPLADPRIVPYASAGIGYCWLWDEYTNYADNVEDTLKFNGMVWRLGLRSEQVKYKVALISCKYTDNAYLKQLQDYLCKIQVLTGGRIRCWISASLQKKSIDFLINIFHKEPIILLISGFSNVDQLLQNKAKQYKALCKAGVLY